MFYLIEISTYSTGAQPGKAIYSFPTMNEALASFFLKMRGAIVNTDWASELCMIINDVGGVQRYEYWKREVIELEPEPEPEEEEEAGGE